MKYGACIAILVSLWLVSPSQAATRLAVLEVDSPALAPVATLLEVELLKLPDTEALERAKLGEILKEQKLQTAFAAEGSAERMALGKILKADVLVLLQAVEKPNPHGNLVVFETRRGLRLQSAPFELTASAENDAQTILPQVKQSLERLRAGVTEIVAVPRFVDESLTQERAYQGEVMARLVESDLLNKPGVLVVELEEAQSLAREVTLGGAAGDARSLPLYLLGEYRYATTAEKPTASFQIKLQRGSKDVGEPTRQEVAADGLMAAMKSAAIRVLTAALGQPSAAIDPAAESQQLVERAKLFVKAGDYATAVELFEAALVLRPDQPLVHGETAYLLDLIYELKRRKGMSLFRATDPASRKFRIAWIQAKRQALPHLEAFFLGNVNSMPGQGPYYAWHAALDTYNLFADPKDEEVSAALKVFTDEREAMKDRVLAAKLHDRVQDGTLFLLGGGVKYPPPLRPTPSNYTPDFFSWTQKHLSEIMELKLAQVEKFAWLKAEWDNWRVLLDFPGLIGLSREHPDEYSKLVDVYFTYLSRAEALKNPEINKMAAALREEYDSPRHPVIVPKYKRPEVVRRDPKDVDVVRHELALRVRTADGRETPLTGAPTHWLRVAPGCEFLCVGGRAYLMKEAGLLTLLPTPRNIPRGSAICSDGRYVWLALPGSKNQLLALDTQSERVWTCAAAEGLPPMNETGGAALCALAPGKIGVAGFFGRTWAGTATLDPESGIKLDVFYEAKEAFESRPEDSLGSKLTSAHAVFELHVISGRPAPDRPVEQRMFLPRTNNFTYVLLDPQRRTAELGELGKWVFHTERVFGVHGGAVYIGNHVGNSDEKMKIKRIGFPELKPLPVDPPEIPNGKLLAYDGEQFVDAGYAKYHTRRFPAGLTLLREEWINEFKPTTIFASNFHGLVIVADDKLYRWELAYRERGTETAVQAPSEQPAKASPGKAKPPKGKKKADRS